MTLTSSTVKKEKVIAYIDGFNLYFGMTETDKINVKWLNVKSLVLNLLKPNQELISVKYFTSRVSGNVDKQKRQTAYLEALSENGVEIIYGKYQSVTEQCRNCKYNRTVNNEKMTDVNIATQMLVDSFKGDCECAMLISGDSDLVPPINAINALGKRVVVAFPPNRTSKEIKNATKAWFTIGITKLKSNQLPTSITKQDGFVLSKPNGW